MTLRELREKRKKLIAEARSILDLAEKENRSMSDEESAKYDTIFEKSQDVGELIDREVRQREAEREIEAAAAQHADETRRAGGDAGRENAAADHVLSCFRSYLATGRVDGEGAEEFRALSAGVNTEGGYLVAPEIFVQGLIKAIDDELHIRRVANVIPVMSGASLGAASLDSDPDDGDWTTELQTGSEDSAMAFGKREMQPHPMRKRVKVSNGLIRSAVLPIEQLVQRRLAYKFGVAQEKAYLTGNGNRRPLGLFTASNDGIPTSRDVSEDNATTAPTMDGLKSAKFALKSGYLANSSWLFHRDVVKIISKLKDSNGQYLWEDSTKVGEPDMLLGRPVLMSEYAPNTMTTGLYVGIIGDFSHYWILDSMAFQIQRLAELYAETNQTGYIGHYEGDGAPVLGEAFARVKLG
jgi:HK97 family phage major capsid protein